MAFTSMVRNRRFRRRFRRNGDRRRLFAVGNVGRRLNKPFRTMGMRVWGSNIGGTQIHRFKRTQHTDIDHNENVGQEILTLRGQSWRFIDMVNSSDFVNLFDAYMITGIKLDFMPMYNSGQATQLTPGLPGVTQLLWVVDKDDDATPGSVAELEERSDLQRRLLTRKVSVFIRPRISRQVFNSLVTTAYEVAQEPVKLDLNSPSVPHFGIKYAFITKNPADQEYHQIIRVYTTYYFRCYTPR